MIPIVLMTGALLLLIGFWGLLTKKNMIKIVLSIALAETGLQLLMIAIGYLPGRTAPILDSKSLLASAITQVVDPVPQALVLTAIVIGVAVNALMLAFVIRIYGQQRSLNINPDKELKW
jgi:multicomponent Na+:H+ antiporter subunit C